MRPVKDVSARGAGLWRSFGFAWDGLVGAAVTQRNMRIHLVAGVLAGAFAAAAPITAPERALILLCAALVIAAEAGNTALEALVDLHGGAPSEPARIAKDAAAGAVLALAAASVAVFFVIVIGHRADPAARWRAALPGLMAGMGLATVTGALLLPRPLPARVVAALLAGGVLVAGGLAVATVSPPGALAAGTVRSSRPSAKYTATLPPAMGVSMLKSSFT